MSGGEKKTNMKTQQLLREAAPLKLFHQLESLNRIQFSKSINTEFSFPLLFFQRSERDISVCHFELFNVHGLNGLMPLEIIVLGMPPLPPRLRTTKRRKLLLFHFWSVIALGLLLPH